MCRGAKRLKVLKAPRLKAHHMETRNHFSVLEGMMEDNMDVAGEDKEKGAGTVTVPQGRYLCLVIVRSG